MDPVALTVGALIVVAAAGAFALAFFFVMVLKRMRLSTIVIRAVGLVLVVIAVCALAIATQLDATAAVGVLGAVAGYLFGAGSSGDSGSVTAGDVGDGNTIVGRDLNQRVDALKAETVHLTQALTSLQRSTEARATGTTVIDLVTPHVGQIADDDLARKIAELIAREHASGAQIRATVGPYLSRRDNFMSTLLVFDTGAETSAEFRTVYACGAERPAPPRAPGR
ncbi:hypothetical protein KXS11_10370 [Plantibacter flavus]|uniref:hypothetical protein n=1 Tax=Plantibacter flavus TaxID=150123 RepID=UPI003F180A52